MTDSAFEALELAVFLRDSGPTDCWICPQCETENPQSAGFCQICGWDRTKKLCAEPVAKTTAPPKAVETAAVPDSSLVPGMSVRKLIAILLSCLICAALLILLVILVTQGL